MEYISVGRRAVAVLIDVIVFFILAIPASMIWGTSYAARTDANFNFRFSIAGAAFFIPLGVWLLYYIVMEATAGGTIGKLITGIRVRREDGSKISWGQSVVRNLLRLVDGLFFYLVGAVFVWNSPERQRLGDHVAKTVVVQHRADWEASVEPPPEHFHT